MIGFIIRVNLHHVKHQRRFDHDKHIVSESHSLPDGICFTYPRSFQCFTPPDYNTAHKSCLDVIFFLPLFRKSDACFPLQRRE